MVAINSLYWALFQGYGFRFIRLPSNKPMLSEVSGGECVTVMDCCVGICVGGCGVIVVGCCIVVSFFLFGSIVVVGFGQSFLATKINNRAPPIPNPVRITPFLGSIIFKTKQII